MSSVTLADPPFKMAAPDILLPPEVLWNLSRLSGYLMLSWNSSEEGDHATISLMFDKTKPSKIRPAAARTKLPQLPLLPDLTRRSSPNIHPDLIDMDNVRARSSTVITISPDKGDELVIPVKREPLFPVQTSRAENCRTTNAISIKKELEECGNQSRQTKTEPTTPKSEPTISIVERIQPQQTTTEPSVTMPGPTSSTRDQIPPQQTKTKPSTPKPGPKSRSRDKFQPQQTSTEPSVTMSRPTTSTRDQIDSLLRVCRSEADKLPSTAFSDEQETEVRHVFVPAANQQMSALDNQKTRQQSTVTASRSTVIASRLLSAAKNGTLGTPSKRPDRRKVSAKKLFFQQDCVGLKATVFTKDTRKRKVFRKVNNRPNKRRSVRPEDTALPAMDNGAESRTGCSKDGDKDRGAVNDRNMETGKSDILRDSGTVEYFLTKVQKHIKYETLSRYNNRQCQFTICDNGPDTFHISCYSSRNKFTTVYSDIGLQWLEKNSWKIPVFIMQQAALRVLCKTLLSRCPSDTVSRRERDLISSLI